MYFSASMRGFAAASLFLPSAAFGQTTEPEIVVTAPLEGARIESLQGASILRRDEIVETLNGGLGDTLAAQPGVASTSFGVGASRPIIRGLGEDRVRVLQNGIGAIDASTASPDHAVTSDGLDAERIEVLRGAAALAYGGNAIGGVVNVIDQSLPTRVIEGFAFDGLAGASSVDEGRQGAASLGAGVGGFAFRLNAAVRETEPYDIPGFAAVDDADSAFGVAPNTWTQYATYGAGGSFIGSQGFAGLAVRRTEGEYGLLGHHDHEEDESEEEHAEESAGGRLEYEQTRIEARGEVRIDVGPFTTLDFAAQHSDYQHTEFEPSGEPGTSFFSDGFEGRVEAHHRGERLRGAIGLQVTDVDFSAEGEEAFVTATNTRDVGLFLVERWDAGGWGLEGGARIERRDLSNVVFGDREFDLLSGSLGAFIRPAEGLFFGATLARTERAPTAFELFSDGPHLATANYELGDPNLQQEQAFSFELSGRYRRGPLELEANLFHVEFDDYIALVERGDIWWSSEDDSGFAPDADDPSVPDDAETLPVFAFVQRDATFVGGELVANARLFEFAGFGFSADAAYDWVRADFSGGGHPPRIPPHTLTVGLEAENPHWTGRVEAVETGEQDRLAPFETVTDGYTFINAGVSFRPYGDQRLLLRLDGRNLTDEEGRAHTSFLKDDLPLPGRNIRFVVTTRF